MANFYNNLSQSVPFKFFIVLATTVALFSQPAVAAESMYDDETIATLVGDTIIPSTTFGRSVQPINRVAENVTIITRADIVRLQARTLADLLLYYPGALPYPYQYPGGFSSPMIQGFSDRHCLVTVDGAPLNVLSEGAVDLSLIPIGNFDTVEIVKGPTSSLWGRSVGGSINLVTREPSNDRIATGYLNASIGTNNTDAAEAVVSGTFAPTGTGYLLAASGGTSDGFQRGIKGNSNAFYVKLKQTIGNKSTITGVIGRTAKDEVALYDLLLNTRAQVDVSDTYGIVKLNHKFSLQSELDINAYFFDVYFATKYFNIAPIPPFIPISGINVLNRLNKEKYGGVQTSFKYVANKYWISTGIDGTYSTMINNTSSSVLPSSNVNLDKSLGNIAGYISGGVDITDRFTVTSSFRYDWYSDLDDTLSPSLGLIYRFDEKTLFRASYGWGYSVPVVTGTSKEFETLWRAQAGMETSKIPGLWLKTTLFYDRSRNIRQSLPFVDQGPGLNQNLTRQGFEIEAKTAPVLKTSLGIGYTYTDIHNSETGQPMHGLPKNHLIGSANWSNQGTELGVYARYVNYNDFPVSNDSLLWDILFSQRVASWGFNNLSLRLAAQNVFSGGQTPSSLKFGYMPLLITGGVRVEF